MNLISLGEHRLLALETGPAAASRPARAAAHRTRSCPNTRSARRRRFSTILVTMRFMKLAVVRGHQEHAVIALEEFLEPDEAFEVEMVARFVRAAWRRGASAGCGRARRASSSRPTARRRHRSINLRAESSTPASTFARAALQRIAVELLEARLHLAKSGRRCFSMSPARAGSAPWRPRAPSARPATRAHRAGAIHHLGHGRCGPPCRRRPG